MSAAQPAPHSTTVEWIRLTDDEGPEGYLVLPEDRASRGAVVGGEMFGVPAHLKAICERLAAEGYAALAPDFYWRHDRRAAFGYDEDSRARAFALLKGLRRDEVIADLTAARATAERYAARGGGRP